MVSDKKQFTDENYDPFEGYSSIEDTDGASPEDFLHAENVDVLLSPSYVHEDHEEQKKEIKKAQKPKKIKTNRRNPFTGSIMWVLSSLSWMFSIALFGTISLFLIGMPFYQSIKNEVTAKYKPIEILKERHYTTTSRVYGDNGVLSEIADENRFYLPLSKIPKQIQDAFIATEDSRFYEHFGVDPKGIIKAILETVLDGDGRGASTITQQMVKNEVFSVINPKTGKKTEAKTTIDRKLKEIVSAIEVEKYLTKEQILEQYLNGILLGRFQTYGVATAAQYYFNQELSQLSLAEIAYLAGTPKAPSSYDLWKNPERAERRKRIVLNRMLDDKYITKKMAEDSKKEPLIPERRVKVSRAEYAGYYAAAVRKNLLNLSEKEGFNQDGLTVYTTINSQLQEYAYKSLRKGLIGYDRRRGWRGASQNIMLENEDGRQINWIEQLDNARLIGLGEWKKAIVLSVREDQATLGFVDGSKGVLDKEGIKWTRRSIKKTVKPGDIIAVTSIDSNRYGLQQIPKVSGALIAMDPNTGKVLALQGGFGYDPKGGAYNRAVDALRQPGSSFKPFVYLAAMENGYTPATNLTDEPVRYGSWQPKNYDGSFKGQMTMRRALCLSRNIPSVKIGDVVGMPKVSDVVKRLGVVTKEKDLRAISHQLASTLGTQEVTPLHMALGYAQIVNGGKKIKPILIDRIQDLSGKMVYRHDERRCRTCLQSSYDGGSMPYMADKRSQVVNPISAFQVTSMMQCVVTNGTATSVGRALNRPVAGKTGTTNDEKDAWFVGFTPDLVVAVYIGFDQPKRLGKGMTGGRLAAPIFNDFMQKALQGQEKTPFRVPEGSTMMYVSNSGWPTYSKEGHLTAFRPGTEPINGPRYLGGGQALLVEDGLGGNNSRGDVTRATGGLW